MNILVSACLLGVNCRYNGTGGLREELLKLMTAHSLIPICPEQLGGLPTPRPPACLLYTSPLNDFSCSLPHIYIFRYSNTPYIDFCQYVKNKYNEIFSSPFRQEMITGISILVI